MADPAGDGPVDDVPPADVPSGDAPRRLSPVPFVVALVGCTVIAVLAAVFLREDRAGDLVQPTSIRVDGADTLVVRAEGPFDGRAEVVQVGYALGDEEIFVELVVAIGDCDDCGPTDSVTATVVLPEAVGDRDVEAGTGRALLECQTVDDATRCVPE